MDDDNDYKKLTYRQTSGWWFAIKRGVARGDRDGVQGHAGKEGGRNKEVVVKQGSARRLRGDLSR
jgi:hypothetical protein